MFTNTLAFTWEDGVRMVEDAAANDSATNTHIHTSAHTASIAARFREGAFGEIRSVSIDEYAVPVEHHTTRRSTGTDIPPKASFSPPSIEGATHFVNESAEWRARIHQLEKTSRQLEDMYRMGQEVQQRLTVQIVERLRRDMQVHPSKAFRDASVPLWELCEEKLAHTRRGSAPEPYTPRTDATTNRQQASAQ